MGYKLLLKIYNNIIQITTLDERWYYDKKTGLYYPSSSWISGYYPKGIAFYKWLADKGWSEAESIKASAGNRGSKVHQALEFYENNGSIKMNDEFLNERGVPEELTVEEWECIMAFDLWHKETNPELLMNEDVVLNEEHGYAGTLDRLYKINGEIWVVDFKTSQYIWPEHEIQVSSYKHAVKNHKVDKQAVLQLGYKRNKKGYKFTEIEDKFDLFLHAKAIWAHENPEAKPKQRDYPTQLILKNVGEIK